MDHVSDGVYLSYAHLTLAYRRKHYLLLVGLAAEDRKWAVH